MCSLPVWLHILARRGADPTRLTARARRNELDISELSIGAEFLVFGHFTEDEDDEGFKATRWLPAADVCDLPEFATKTDNLVRAARGRARLAGARRR